MGRLTIHSRSRTRQEISIQLPEPFGSGTLGPRPPDSRRSPRERRVPPAPRSRDSLRAGGGRERLRSLRAGRSAAPSTESRPAATLGPSPPSQASAARPRSPGEAAAKRKETSPALPPRGRPLRPSARPPPPPSSSPQPSPLRRPLPARPRRLLPRSEGRPRPAPPGPARPRRPLTRTRGGRHLAPLPPEPRLCRRVNPTREARPRGAGGRALKARRRRRRRRALWCAREALSRGRAHTSLAALSVWRGVPELFVHPPGRQPACLGESRALTPAEVLEARAFKYLTSYKTPMELTIAKSRSLWPEHRQHLASNDLKLPTVTW